MVDAGILSGDNIVYLSSLSKNPEQIRRKMKALLLEAQKQVDLSLNKF